MREYLADLEFQSSPALMDGRNQPPTLVPSATRLMWVSILARPHGRAQHLKSLMVCGWVAVFQSGSSDFSGE